MSNEITSYNDGVIPDYIRQAPKSDLMHRVKSGMHSLKRISIRAKVFRCIVVGEQVAKNTTGYMDVFVLNVADEISRMYYEGEYDANAETAKPPTCWSSDSRVPSSDVPSPMAPTCAACSMNINGSGANNSKACRFKRRIAVALSTDIDSGVYQLELPATSIFGKANNGVMPFNAYLKYVDSQGVNIEYVTTRMSFDDEASAPKLTFKVVGFAGADMLPAIDELAKSPDSLLAVQQNVYVADNKNTAREISAAQQTEMSFNDGIPPPKVLQSPKPNVKPDISAKLSDVLKQFAASPVTESDED